MALLEINWRPSDRQLRQFGLLCIVMLPLFGWILVGHPALEPWNRPAMIVVGGLAVAGGLLGSIGVLQPQGLRLVFVSATLLAWPIGLVVSEVLLAVIYFGVFTPVALVFRLIGRDALERRIDRGAASYWRPKIQPADIRRYYRQY